MYLYFNGDSYVAGTELGDFILPNYPGLSVESPRLRKSDDPKNEWFKYARKIRWQEPYSSDLRRLEYERSFPNKVATKLNLPFTNKALGGSSMDRIARTTIADLIELKKNNPNEKIIAVIGTTDFHRSEIASPKVSSELLDSCDYWRCISIHNAGRTTDADLGNMIDIVKYKMSYETNYHGLINFYKNVILVQDFCKLNNICLFWTSFWETENFIRDTKSLENKNDYSCYKDYIDLKYTFSFRKCYYENFEGEEVICPGGHLAEPVHDFAAEMITEIIKNTL